MSRPKRMQSDNEAALEIFQELHNAVLALGDSIRDSLLKLIDALIPGDDDE